MGINRYRRWTNEEVEETRIMVMAVEKEMVFTVKKTQKRESLVVLWVFKIEKPQKEEKKLLSLSLFLYLCVCVCVFVCLSGFETRLSWSAATRRKAAEIRNKKKPKMNDDMKVNWRLGQGNRQHSNTLTLELRWYDSSASSFYFCHKFTYPQNYGFFFFLFRERWWSGKHSVLPFHESNELK